MVTVAENKEGKVTIQNQQALYEGNTNCIQVDPPQQPIARIDPQRQHVFKHFKPIPNDAITEIIQNVVLQQMTIQESEAKITLSSHVPQLLQILSPSSLPLITNFAQFSNNSTLLRIDASSFMLPQIVFEDEQDLIITPSSLKKDCYNSRQ
jgi:hypothetical protein